MLTVTFIFAKTFLVSQEFLDLEIALVIVPCPFFFFLPTTGHVTNETLSTLEKPFSKEILQQKSLTNLLTAT